MKKLKFISIFILSVSLLAISCKKGDTGPAGARGPAGPDSVQYSGWTTLALTFNTTDSLYEQNITAAAITQDILDKGIILSYINFTDQSGASNVFNASEILSVTYSVGKVNLASPANFSGVTLQFRYVVVAGTIALNGMRTYKGYSQADLQKMSYTDAMNTIGMRPN
jgi:hypothetical protein